VFQGSGIDPIADLAHAGLAQSQTHPPQPPVSRGFLRKKFRPLPALSTGNSSILNKIRGIARSALFIPSAGRQWIRHRCSRSDLCHSTKRSERIPVTQASPPRCSTAQGVMSHDDEKLTPQR
jgi:hypothetical protein